MAAGTAAAAASGTGRAGPLRVGGNRAVPAGRRAPAARGRHRSSAGAAAALAAGLAAAVPVAVEPTGLLVRREADGEVRFAALSPLAVYLLASIGEQPGLEGQAYLQHLANAHGLAEDALAGPGAAWLRQCLQAGVSGPLTAPP
ncbi:hypothetical protein G6F31_018572 [Rhizopus arrhizus]|nr:hypothetical protein G6F31_018572 [Rhizopus arrhizus]